MLDAYIIEEIKRQEEARRRREDEARPRVRIERDLPPAPKPISEEPRDDPEDEPRGPVRIDIDDVTIPIRSPNMARGA